MINNIIYVLYINKTEREAQSFIGFLSKVESARFETVWYPSAEKALEYLDQKNKVDVIVTDDVLSGMNGIEFIRILKDMKYDIPVVFLTSSDEINIVVEVMHLGAKDCLLKDDIYNSVFPQALLRIVEKNRLKQEVLDLEIKQKRLKAMQEIVVNISDKISEPLNEMENIVSSLEKSDVPEKAVKFLKLMKENIERMQAKLEKLRNLKEDKTVKYIRDIKMIDLS